MARLSKRKRGKAGDHRGVSSARPVAEPAQPAPPPSSQNESKALRQIREAVEALVTEGRTQDAISYSLSALAAVLQRNYEVELLLKKLRREQVGKRSERIDPAQLQLLFEELRSMQQQPAPPDLDNEEREDANLDKEIEDNTETPEKKKRSRRGDWTSEKVQRNKVEAKVPAEERLCPTCGREKSLMGYEVSRVLRFIPASFVEDEYHGEKLACGRCKDGVTTAPGPERVLPKSPADASLLAHVATSKYTDHTPLHRLHRQYLRSGADIAVSTLADWNRGVADLLLPLAELQLERILRAFVVSTDATGLKVLDPSSPENIQRGTMWCLVGDGRDVVFKYTPTGEGATGPWLFLRDRTGYIQSDAHSVFDRLFNGRVANATWIGCWAHGRRGFYDLIATDPRVAYPLMLIRRLYRIETLADVKKLDPVARTKLRKERSTVVLDKLKRGLVASLVNESPDTQFAKACAYILNNWEGLTRFIDDGRLALDNNLCERQIRDLALGRKNYLFAGSHEAAVRAATMYTLTRSCAQWGVSPLPYLTDVLRKLAAGWKQSDLEELLPHRWLELHAPALSA